jgi:TPR repeat protein
MQQQHQMGQQTNYQMAQNYRVSSPVSVSGPGYGSGSRLYDQIGSESYNQMNSASQISTSPQRFPPNPNQMSYNDHSSLKSSMQNAQNQFYMAEYHRQGSPSSLSPVSFPRQSSPGIAIGPAGTPIPSGAANRSNWGQRTPTPDRTSRPQPNTNIRLLIDDKIARRMTMTSVTLANDEKALQKYRDAAKKTNDPNVQVDYAKFLINMIECQDTSGVKRNNEQIQEKYNKLVEEASYWINLLAKKDNAEAMYIKGTWYEYGKFGKEVKQEKAFRLYLSASKNNFPKANYKVAEHYEKNKDVKRALQFYKKAASQGDVSALYVSLVGLVVIRFLLLLLCINFILLIATCSSLFTR